ncbi:uncharacterized protein [Magallana gigas]|uniref:uncharacterized protein n=1 Tax=Magallana gigas TaxID=29159 RepID=UPI0033405C42
MELFAWILLLSPLFQECLGSEVWKIVPRLLDGGIAEIPSKSYNGSTTFLCALECQMRPPCQLFRYNPNTSECDLYDGIKFKRTSYVHRNQFYQKMPDHCVTGRDEWFPEYQTCIWIPTHVSPYEEAKRLCESAGKVMLGINNFSQVLYLMDLINTKYIHIYSRRTGDITYEMDDGTLFPSTLWCPGQPYEYLDCIGVQNDPQSNWCTYPGLDDYEYCSHSSRFLCV